MASLGQLEPLRSPTIGLDAANGAGGSPHRSAKTSWSSGMKGLGEPSMLRCFVYCVISQTLWAVPVTSNAVRLKIRERSTRLTEGAGWVFLKSPVEVTLGP
jgi:hypothetical protein